MLSSLLSKAHQKFLSMPLLGPITDGFDDWLVPNGYTRGARKNSLRMLQQVVDLKKKHQAIAKVKPVPRRSRTPRSKDRTILDWLESL
jgi:hypothetical protein